MLPLRYARTWLLAGLVLMVLGLLSALLPMPVAVEATVDDKILHGAVFLAFTVWFGGVFDRRLPRSSCPVGLWPPDRTPAEPDREPAG